MRVAGFGATFFSAMSVTLIAFVCYAFVDDTDVVHTAQDVFTTGKTIMVEMQTVIDHWEGGLRATGGAIVPKKKLLVPHRLDLGEESLAICYYRGHPRRPDNTRYMRI